MLACICICSGVDVYTALAGAVGALYGPLHGGANEVLITKYLAFHNNFMLISSCLEYNFQWNGVTIC